MKRGLLAVLCLFLVAVTVFAAPQIASPDGKVVVAFALQAGGTPAYTSDYLAKPLVLESRFGLLDFDRQFAVVGTTTGAHDGQWTDEFGARRIVPDNWRELRVDLKHAAGRRVRLAFRACNEGAARRYEFPAQATKQFQFAGELTEFRLPPGTLGYKEHGTEANTVGRRSRTSSHGASDR